MLLPESFDLPSSSSSISSSSALLAKLNLSDLLSALPTDAELEGILQEEEDADQALLKALGGALVFCCAMAGVLSNVFVLLLSLFSVRGDYRLFIANMALVDSLCALLYAFMGLLWSIGRPLQRQLPLALLTQSALCFYGSFGILVAALVPVSFSRIVAAWWPKHYERLFGGRRALFICLSADLVPVLLLLAMARSHSIFFLFSALTILAYALTFLLNLAVFRFVAKHIRVVQSLRDRNRLAETRQVAMATLLQALVPLLCQVPAFLTLSSALLLVRPLSSTTLIWLTQLWLAASPLLDSLVTVLVIKPYRLQSRAILRKLWSGLKGISRFGQSPVVAKGSAIHMKSSTESPLDERPDPMVEEEMVGEEYDEEDEVMV